MAVFGESFGRLLEKYSVDMTLLVRAPGARGAGRWAPGEEVCVALRGAVVPLPERKMYHPGGVYAQADRQLLLPGTLCEMVARAPGGAALLPALAGGVCGAGAHILHGGRRYAVEEETDHGDYAYVAVYILRYVGMFDAKAPEGVLSDGRRAQN